MLRIPGQHRAREKSMQKLLGLLGSRKFWAAVVSILFLVFGERGGIDQGALIAGVATLIAYILGTALEDGLRANGNNG